MEENNIDKYFKERLHAHAEVPSGDVWERIDAQLTSTKGVKAAGLHWRSLALLSLALLLLVSGLFYWRMDRLDKENSALERELTEQRAIPFDQTDSAVLEKTQKLDPESSIPPLEDNEALSAINQNGTRSKAEVEIEITPTQSNSSLRASTDRENTNPQGKDIENPEDSAGDIKQNQGKSIEDPSDSRIGISAVSLASQDPSLIDDALSIASGSTDNSDQAIGDASTETNPPSSRSTTLSGSAQEAVLDQSNDLNIGALIAMVYIPIDIGPLQSEEGLNALDSSWTPDQRIQFLGNPKWSLGLAAYQNSTFRRIKSANTESKQVRSELNRIERASKSLGVRGYLGYRLGKRTSLTLGLDYSQWKQQGSYSISYVPGTPDVTTGTTAYSFESELVTSTSTEDVLLQATFGPGEAPWEEEFGQLPQSSYSVNVEREEQITFLSLPLTLRYQTYLGRLGLQGGVGLAYDLLLNSSRETRISGDFEDSNVSNTAVQKDGFISAHAEAGVFYRFSERNKIYIGPRFKSWLVPLYENEDLRTFPYSNAIEVGVEIGL